MIAIDAVKNGKNGTCIHSFKPHTEKSDDGGKQKEKPQVFTEESRRKKSHRFATMHMSGGDFGYGGRNGVVDSDIKIRGGSDIIDTLLKDGKLTKGAQIIWKRGINRYWLCLNCDVPPKPIPDHEPRIVSLDPGVRTFQTFYSPDGTDGELLVNVLPRMKKFKERMERLELVLRDQTDPKTGERLSHQKLRRRRARHAKLSTRLYNYTRNAHYDAIGYLLTNYDLIIIPPFEVKNMVPGKRLSRKTKKDMYLLSHYKFRQRLKERAALYPNKLVLDECNEVGTSRTCGMCGHWHEQLGVSKVFNCPKCGLVIDRDLNGARNILLKLL